MPNGNLKKEIGTRICLSRKAKKITQKEICELLDGPSLQMVSGWEKGHSIPTAIYLIKLSKILDKSIDYLLTGSEKTQFDKKIVSYKDLSECIVALDNCKIFSIQQGIGNTEYVSAVSHDTKINSFFTEYTLLKNALMLLDKETYEKSLEKLLLKYDVSIRK